MHIVRNKSSYKNGKKIYQSVLLRTSYRENGKVKKKTIANLSGCSEAEISAMELALKHKDDLSALGSLPHAVTVEQGLSVGAVWCVYELARRLGIAAALGDDFSDKLALWQVVARVIDQGSRLSAVRLAQAHAGCEVLGISRGFDENDLYDSLAQLAKRREAIEARLWQMNAVGKESGTLFLYDVTSSYLEGDANHFGAYGYNRDGKRNKKQIVIGLLCDGAGEPVSAEVFAGNTQDAQTFAEAVKTAAERFGCERVTWVGDRGMIKSAQREQLPQGCHYITAITKAQVRTLLARGVLQRELFDNAVVEVEFEGVRYVVRRNPVRADELGRTREEKYARVAKAVKERNDYMQQHGRARVETAVKQIERRCRKLKVDGWVRITTQERTVVIGRDEAVRGEEALLDGCYVITTNLPASAADAQTVHDRYKDLALVEKAFRDCKTVTLEVRPVYVRSRQSTQAHVLVVMLAYKIIRYLRRAWSAFDMTVAEGLKRLSLVSSVRLRVETGGSCMKIARPDKLNQQLLDAAGVVLPEALPERQCRVVTRKKLAKRRKHILP